MYDVKNILPKDLQAPTYFIASVYVWNTRSLWCEVWKSALEKEGFAVHFYDLHACSQNLESVPLHSESSIEFYEFRDEASYIHLLHDLLPELQEKGIYTVLITPSYSEIELVNSLRLVANWILSSDVKPGLMQDNFKLMLQLLRIQQFSVGTN